MTKADEGEKNAVNSKLPLRLQDTPQYEDLHEVRKFGFSEIDC